MPKVSKKDKTVLQKEYVEKCRHATISAMKWTEKIAHLARSKKYGLNDEQKEKILSQYDAMREAVQEAFEAPPEEKVEEDTFKL